MDPIAVLLFAALLFVLVGATMGILAARRARTLSERLEHLSGELRDLRRLVAKERARPDDRERSAAPESLPEEFMTATPAGRPCSQEPPEPSGSPVVEPAASESAPQPVVEPGIADPHGELPGFSAIPGPPAVPSPVDAPWPESGSNPVVSREPEPGRAHPTASTPDGAQPAFVGVEQAVGLRWLTWIGIGLLFLGVAFFLKYAYDRDWLGRFFGPRLRIATAAGAALTLALLGWRSLKNGMQALGQGLLGGGQALAYLTIFAAYQPAVFVVDEPLIGPTATFSLMAVVTAIGLAGAVRLDAVAMAFLAVLGGFATPVLIRTGHDSRDALCVYLLLLDLGVLYVTAQRRWRALDLLAFVGTCGLFAGWWLGYGDLHPQPDATLAWVLVFHLVFAVLPFLPHWKNGTPVALERFVLALANLAATLWFLGGTLRIEAPALLAACCLLGAPFYLGLGWITARRVGSDARTRDGFLALAVFLLSLGLFYLLPGAQVATAWFAEAVVLTWLGYRFAHAPTRTWALVVFAVAAVRTVLRLAESADPALPFVWNARFAAAAIAGLAGFAMAFVHRRGATEERERLLAPGFGITAGYWLLGIGAEEIARHAGLHGDEWLRLRPAVAIAWLQTIGALAFLVAALRLRSAPVRTAGMLPLVASALATASAYVGHPADAWPVLNGACLAGLGALVTLVAFAHWADRIETAPRLRATWWGAAQFATSVLATVETAAYLQRGAEDPTAASMALALGCVWLALGAVGVAYGAALQSRRVFALALLPLAASAFVPMVLYAERVTPHVLVANARYLFTAAVCAAIALLRPQLLRMQNRAADFVGAAGFAWMLLWSAVESSAYAFATHEGERGSAWCIWWLGLTAVLGVVGGSWRANATGNRLLRAAARSVLVLAVPLPLLTYAAAFPSAWMFANLRFLLVVAAVAAVHISGRVEPKGLPFGPLALGLAVLGLTFEPAKWFLEHTQDPELGLRLAKFSITVTWVVVAAALLVAGFRLGRRGLRLGALGLFALTAGKLLAFDMSGAQQLYRILAFVLVGIAFVAASWLYHRVERRMAKGSDAAR